MVKIFTKPLCEKTFARLCIVLRPFVGIPKIYELAFAVVNIGNRRRDHAFWCLQMNKKLEPWSLVYILQQ